MNSHKPLIAGIVVVLAVMLLVRADWRPEPAPLVEAGSVDHPVAASPSTRFVEVSDPAASETREESSRVLAATLWTCTVRWSSTYDGDAEASCSGSEKAISGGCWNSGTGGQAKGRPTGQGWRCPRRPSETAEAFANCCY